MKVELMKWDAAKYLKDEETINEFLAGSWLDSIEDGDPDLFVGALAVAARARGMTQLAKDSGLGRESLYKALTPGKKPQFATIQKIMNGLGVDLVVRPAAPPKAKPRARTRKTTAAV